MSTMTLEQVRDELRATADHADSGYDKAWAIRLADAIDAYLRERESAKSHFPKVNGISRDGECSKVLSIFFAIRPTDDEMRAVHDYLSCREAAKVEVADEIVNKALEELTKRCTDESYFPNSDDMRAALEAVAPHLASARVPDGWYLVPVMPTHEMLKSADAEFCKRKIPSIAQIVYQAMLAAAPKPEKEG